MFRLGELAARVLLVAGGLTLAALAAFALLQPPDAAAVRRPFQIDLRSGVVILLLTIAVVVILAGYLQRIWTEPLRAVVEHTRRAADGLDQPPPAAAAEAGELALLVHSIGRLRRRYRQQAEAIDRQRQVLADLVRQLQEGVIVADARGQIVLINPAAMRMLHLRPPTGGDFSAFVGQAVERCIPQHDVQRILHAGRPEGKPDSNERAAAPVEEAAFIVDTEAGRLNILARAADLTVTRGDTIVVPNRFVVLTDMTQLNAALQMKADFVANASHELRTPLSTIRAAVETLLHLDLAAEAEDAARFIGLIDRHSARLGDMVSDLLDLSRVEAGRTTQPPREIELPELFSDLEERFVGRMAEKQLEWRPLLEGSLRPILASPYLLQLILDNLVDNAIKFSPPGAAIEIGARCSDAYVRFDVRDHGCGIPEADRRRVFERFYQVERARSGGERRGTGLGLAIVKHAAQLLGGAVALQSKVNVGTRITVILPWRPENGPLDVAALDAVKLEGP